MKRLSTLILMMTVISSAVYAHHSAAGIDRSKAVTIEGTVKQFKWGNPHAWLDVEVPNKNGDPGGLFVSVTLPDGRTMTEQAAPAAPPAPPAAK